MDGSGSGRWGTGKADAKDLVESCRSLEINRLGREGAVRPIPLVTTALVSGGRRWWLECRASRAGIDVCLGSSGQGGR